MSRTPPTTPSGNRQGRVGGRLLVVHQGVGVAVGDDLGRVLPGADPVDVHRLGQVLLLVPVGQLGQLVVGAEDAEDRVLGDAARRPC